MAHHNGDTCAITILVQLPTTIKYKETEADMDENQKSYRRLESTTYNDKKNISDEHVKTYQAIELY